METAIAVFDATRPVAIQLRTPDGVKVVRVKFPSDADWTERQRRRKVIIKQLGRGVSETNAPNGEEVDAALLEKIRTEEGGPAIDPFEAQKVIEILSLCEVDDVTAAGNGYRVVLRVLGATTVHLVKVPTIKDVTEFRRSFARLLDLPFGRQELSINLRPAADLYKKLIDATEGYVGEPPIIHQAAAVKAAIDALDASMQEDRDANF